MAVTKKHKRHRATKTATAIGSRPGSGGGGTQTDAPSGRRPGGVLIPPGFFYVYRNDTYEGFLIAHGPRGFRPVDGYGGFNPVARPKRVAILQYDGSNPMALECTFLMGGPPFEQSVEDDLQALENMALKGDADPAPPVLTLSGALRYRFRQMDWVLNNIEWDDDVVIKDDNVPQRRLRDGGTLTFVQMPKDQRVKFKEADKAQKKVGKQVTYKITHEDTKHGNPLAWIAKKKLGDPDRYKEIMKINGIRDPKKVRAGQTIKLPAK